MHLYVGWTPQKCTYASRFMWVARIQFGDTHRTTALADTTISWCLALEWDPSEIGMYHPSQRIAHDGNQRQ